MRRRGCRPGLGPWRHSALALLGRLCRGRLPQSGGALAFSGLHAPLYLKLPGAKPFSALAVCPTALKEGFFSSLSLYSLNCFLIYLLVVLGPSPQDP